jgi:glutamine---fructose-6-phosphate transaminase (isomerizing)
MFHLLARELSGATGGDIERLPELAAASLTLQPQIEAMVGRYAFMNHCVVVGRGLNYANAYEFAIKLMETCYVVAERFSSADFQHGPIAMVEQAISSEAAAIKAATRGLKIPQRISETLSPIPYVIPAQLFAALLAAAKGINPDQPRSLSKVTKTV